MPARNPASGPPPRPWTPGTARPWPPAERADRPVRARARVAATLGGVLGSAVLLALPGLLTPRTLEWWFVVVGIRTLGVGFVLLILVVAATLSPGSPRLLRDVGIGMALGPVALGLLGYLWFVGTLITGVLAGVG